MKPDDLSGREHEHEHDDVSFDYPGPSSSAGSTGGPLADREVPVPNAQASTLLDQWLDGEIPVTTMVAADGGDSVDLWNKINNEAEILRSRTTPLYVHKRIMDSLPEDTYRKSSPWYRRSIAMTPPLLVGAAIGLVAIGAAVAWLVTR